MFALEEVVSAGPAIVECHAALGHRELWSDGLRSCRRVVPQFCGTSQRAVRPVIDDCWPTVIGQATADWRISGPDPTLEESSSSGWPMNRLALTCGLGLLLVGSSIGAQSVSCSAQKIGSTTYTSCSDGSRSTSQRIGSSTYTSNSDGSTSTAQRIGNTTFLNDSRGGYGSSQRIGSSTYTNYSTGDESLSLSRQRIGSSTYLDGRSSSGATISGGSQRIGTTTYGSTSITQPRTTRKTSSPLNWPDLP